MCLRRVAEALFKLCWRPGELAARYGGEEFGLLLPETDLGGARRFVARALKAAADIQVEGIALPGGIGLSIGAVSLIPSPVYSMEDVLRVADEGLYKAKHGGRRRGVVCDMETRVASELLADFEDSTS